MDKLWSKSEIAHLKRHAESQTLEELAQRFHTDTETVRHKIEELGFSQKAGNIYDKDVAFGHFEKGIKLFHEKKFAKAAAEFEKSIAETDLRQLGDRAGQYLRICQNQIEVPEELEDLYLAAVMKKNEGDLDAALELCKKQVGSKDPDEKMAYLMASIQALANDEEGALASLDRAIELDPKNRVHAYHDSDFSELRGTEGLTQLLGTVGLQAQPASDPTVPDPEAAAPASPDASVFVAEP